MKNLKNKTTGSQTNKTKRDFFDKVYQTTKRIPFGKVTTYGHIAEFIGIKSAARTVGWALNGCGRDVPAHRVVNRYGALTGRIHFGDPELMEALLISEGVEFDDNGCVNMDKHLWVPGIKKRMGNRTNTSKKTKRKK